MQYYQNKNTIQPKASEIFPKNTKMIAGVIFGCYIFWYIYHLYTVRKLVTPW